MHVNLRRKTMKQQWTKWVGGIVLASGTVAQASAAERSPCSPPRLTNALQDIATQYQKGKDVQVVSSFASSSTLARQIEQGAPADLFISADQQWMDYAIDKQQMVKDTRYTLLGNELVLIAAKSDKQIRSPSTSRPTGPSCSTAAVWRWAIRITCRPASTPKRRWNTGRLERAGAETGARQQRAQRDGAGGAR